MVFVLISSNNGLGNEVNFVGVIALHSGVPLFLSVGSSGSVKQMGFLGFSALGFEFLLAAVELILILRQEPALHKGICAALGLGYGLDGFVFLQHRFALDVVRFVALDECFHYCVGQVAVGFLAGVAGNLLFLNLEAGEGFQHIVQGVELGRAKLSGFDEEGLRGVDGLLVAVDAGSGVFHSYFFLSCCWASVFPVPVITV